MEQLSLKVGMKEWKSDEDESGDDNDDEVACLKRGECEGD